MFNEAYFCILIINYEVITTKIRMYEYELILYFIFSSVLDLKKSGTEIKIIQTFVF